MSGSTSALEYPKIPNGRRGCIRKLIFLDVDGVLHEAHFARRPFRSDCMKALALLVQSTHADIVLSSSWRTFEAGKKAVAKALAKFDIGPMIGATDHAAKSRAECITRWVSTNIPHSDDVRYISLDDEDMTMELKEHMVRTKPKGMTMRDALRGIAILNNTPAPVFDDSDSDDSSYETSCTESGSSMAEQSSMAETSIAS